MLTEQGRSCSLRQRLLFGLALVLAIGVAVPAQLSAQEGYEVHGIDFQNNGTLPDGLLQTRITTSAISSFKRKILGKDAFLFSNDILQSDLRRIERLYQREGFLNIRIEPADLIVNHKKRSVHIVVQITEGAPIRVSKVGLSISGTIGNPTESHSMAATAYLSVLKTRTGVRFRDSLIHQDQVVLVRMFEDLGYPYAKAEPYLTVDHQANEVDIEWQVVPGLLCRFGDVTITGLNHADEGLIRKPLTFKSGDIYSRAALEESQRRIYGLSLFHVATVNAKLSSEPSPIVPVEIKIDEAPRLSTRIGVGYGREEKFRIYSDSYLLGFLGGARQLKLYLKHSDLEPYHASLKLRQPAFLTSYTTLEITPFVLRQREPAFDEIRYGGFVTLLHQLASNLHGSATYSFERVELDIGSLGDPAFDTTGREDLYNKSSVMFGLTFDNSAPMFSPDRGLYAAGTFKVSGLGLGSDYHYTRLLLDIRRYQKLYGVILAGRVKTGGLKSGDESEFIPVEDRFYAGGSASVRGWARAELGPRASDDTPVGGNTLLESSLELRYPIYGLLSGVLFYDFGNVWPGSYSFHLDDLRYSAGLGLRVRTPIGPIRFDIAQPVADDETTIQYHISVGEAF